MARDSFSLEKHRQRGLARPARHATCKSPRTDSKPPPRQGTGRSIQVWGPFPLLPCPETPYSITWTWDPPQGPRHMSAEQGGKGSDSSCFQLRKTSVDDEAGRTHGGEEIRKGKESESDRRTKPALIPALWDPRIEWGRRAVRWHGQAKPGSRTTGPLSEASFLLEFQGCQNAR